MSESSWDVREETFADVLYEWMQRAPWLAISAAAHVVLFLIVQAIPWSLFERQEEIVLHTDVARAPAEVFEDPPPEEPPPEVEPQQVTEDPTVQDVDVVDDPNDDFDEQDLELGDPRALFDELPSDRMADGILGLGPGAVRGKYRGRFGKGAGPGRGGQGTRPALELGLRWLAGHQDPDGSWDGDGFMKHDPPDDRCTGPGDPLHDVGVTGLALLAFLGDGNTLTSGAHKDVVTRGVKWLRDQQDFESGLLGEEIGHTFLYDHAIGALAISEAYYFSRSQLLRGTAQKATNYILQARNPYGAWRYDVPPVGDDDTSVTGWMVFALKSAEEGDLKVERDAFVGALNWIDEVTDPANGRVGYDAMGSPSSRVTGINDHFPAEKGEAMTAVGLLCRFFLGQDPREEPVMRKHADLLLQSLPEWDPEGHGCDMYYWYYGTYAMYQMGGRHWEAWNKAMKSAVLGSQRKDGAHAGSWDPVGPWGHSGGRVYSTALMTLCLEVYFRYSRVLGAR